MTTGPNPHKDRTGLRRMIWATRYSAQGLRKAYITESAFRQEVWLAAVLMPASVLLGRDWTEMALLAGSAMLLLIVELLNSAVEAAVDRISYEHHPLAENAKDFGSAAVMVALLLCGAVWAAALWSRFFA